MVVHPTYRTPRARCSTACCGASAIAPARRRASSPGSTRTRPGWSIRRLDLGHPCGDAEGRTRQPDHQAVPGGRARYPVAAGGTHRAAAGRDTADRRVVVVRPDGQAAETRYEVLSSCSGGPSGPPDVLMSLLSCEPITGRTHQIRVHLAAQGWPIVGDRVYGQPDPRIARQALHAWHVTLPHPVTRQRLEIEAPAARRPAPAASELHVVEQLEVPAHLRHQVLDQRQVVAVQLVGRVVEPRGDRVGDAAAAERVRREQPQQL